MKTLHEFKQKVGDKEYNIKLKDMSRRDREELAVVYNAEYGKALAKGLATHAALRKNIVDSGGFFSQKEIERMEELYRLIVAKSNEFQALELEKKDSSEIKAEIEDLWAEYQEYEKVSTALYSRSAEFEAEKNTVTWAVLNFTFADDRELFPGSTNDSRLNFYYECVESGKELEVKVFDKAYGCFYQVIKTSEPMDSEMLKSITGD